MHCERLPLHDQDTHLPLEPSDLDLALHLVEGRVHEGVEEGHQATIEPRREVAGTLCRQGQHRLGSDRAEIAREDHALWKDLGELFLHVLVGIRDRSLELDD